MNKFVVVVFPDEKSAYEGVHALQDLHENGSVSLFALSVVYRDPSGNLSIKQQVDSGPLGLGVGALVGGLIGLFGGPAGAAVGVAGGALVGSWRDFIHAEVSDDFLEGIQNELGARKYAVVAEVAEEWTTPINVRMEQVGGTVVREPRAAFVDELIEKRMSARKAEYAQRKAERASEKAERMQAKLASDLEEAQRKLDRTAQKARTRLDEVSQEMNAKIATLQEQAEKSTPETRNRIQQRIVDLRKDLGEREQMLNHAYEIAQEALRS